MQGSVEWVGQIIRFDHSKLAIVGRCLIRTKYDKRRQEAVTELVKKDVN